MEHVHLDPILKEELTARALLSEEDMQSGRVYTKKDIAFD